MSRTPALLRATLAVAVGLSTAALLSACFSPVVISGTPKPTSTGFASIGDTPEPIDTGTPVEPTAAPADGYVNLQDDLQVLAVAAPAAWTDVDTAPFTDDSGQQWASIVAATNIDDYFGTFTASGVEVAAAPIDPSITDDELKTFLTNISGFLTDGCETLEDHGDYSDPFYTGFESIFQKCGGEDTEGFAIVTVNTDRTHVIYVIAQIAGADEDPDAIFSEITNTFQATL